MRPWSLDPRFDPSRRQALHLLLATAAAGAAGCAPVRLGLGAYPRDFKSDAAGVTDATLEAFVAAVMPGLGYAAATARLMQDPFFGFHAYAGYFASELDRAARRRHAQSFAALRPREQHAIVADGLASGGIEARLYTGAVFLAQVLGLTGAHDDTAGAPLIDFPGAIGMPMPAAVHYDDDAAFRVPSLSDDGNPA